MQSPYYWRQVQDASVGSGIANVNASKLSAMRIPIPPLKYQDVLISLLDKLDERRTSATSHLAIARETIGRFRTAVLAAACSGRLSADWRESHPEAPSVEKALLEMRRARKRKPSSNEPQLNLPFPEFPRGYVVSSVGESSQTLQYGTSKRCEASPEDGVPVLRMGNIQEGQLDLGNLKYCALDQEIDRLLLLDGDLLFNRTNSPELVGKSAVFHGAEPTSFASYLIRVRFAEHVAHPDFVNYWINSAWGRQWARTVKSDGVSQSNINGTKLSFMPLPLPPFEEQLVIVERAARMLQHADEISARIEAANRLSQQSFQAILTKA